MEDTWTITGTVGLTKGWVWSFYCNRTFIVEDKVKGYFGRG